MLAAEDPLKTTAYRNLVYDREKQIDFSATRFIGISTKSLFKIANEIIGVHFVTDTE